MIGLRHYCRSFNSQNARLVSYSVFRGLKNSNGITFIRHVRTSTRSKLVSATQQKINGGAAAINTGRLFLGGACASGIGLLCFYGLGLSNDVGAIDTARFWPAETRQKIKSTFLYFTGSLGITALSAYRISKSQKIMQMLNGSRLMVFGGTLVAMIGSGMACRAIEYQPGLFNAKHLAWAVHSGTVGLVIAPLMLLGGPLVVRAATYTAGAVGGLALTAACAPDGKFLTWGGPLALGLGGVAIASLGGMFLPATSAAMPFLYSIYMYGGLVVFGGFVLYDTQKIITSAQSSTLTGRKYDPINASIGIYLDTINIFIRILMLLSGSGGKSRR